MTLRRSLVLAALVVSGVAGAQPQKPELMPLPVTLRRVPAGVTADDKERLQREFSRQLKLAGASLPEFTRSEAALKDVKGLDCAREDACLAQVAKRAGVLYGLFASLDVTVEGTLVATARVVRDDGEVVRPQVSVSKPRGTQSFLDAARQLIAQLVVKLDPGSLPVQRPVAVTPVVTAPNKPVEAPVAPQPAVEAPSVAQVQKPVAPARTSTVGWVVLGSGAAVAVAGAVVGLIGFGAGTSVSRTMGLLERAEDAVRIRQAGQLATIGLIGVGVGAVGALVGALLLGTSSATTASLWLSPHGGALVTFGGAL